MDAAGTAADAGQQAAEEAAAPLPRENAVLVFGGTGKLGRRIVEKVRERGSSACEHKAVLSSTQHGNHYAWSRAGLPLTICIPVQAGGSHGMPR